MVKTPTATVTDLGTEFGVEVSKTGTTETHVFVGKIRVAGSAAAGRQCEQILLAGQAVRLGPHSATAAVFESSNEQFVRKMPVAQQAAVRELIGQIDYSDTWTANSPTRAGSRLLLSDPESLRVEQCHGNPPRWWVFCAETVMTTWPGDNSPVPWPGHKAPGSKSGFSETICTWDGYFGFEYGLRDDFVVQFDAVQTDDRINVTIGDKPATIGAPQSLSVFFRATGVMPSRRSRNWRVRGAAGGGRYRPSLRHRRPVAVAQLRRPLQPPREAAHGLGRSPVPRHDRSGRHHPGTDTRGRPIVGQLALDQSIRDHRRLFPERRNPRVDRQLPRRVAAGSRTIEPVCVTVKENRMGYDFCPEARPPPAPEATF